MHTRYDFEYIRNNKIEGWEQEWLGLLEGRFVTDGGELIEDPNAPIFRIGFTVAEVQDDIGFSGYTNREIEWYTSQPDRFDFIDDRWQQKEGWEEQHEAESKLTALEQKLTEVDRVVAFLQSGTFEYDGHQYYLDRDYISDQIVALPLLPETYTRQWKTADKIGVDNVYVTLDKAGITAMGMACFERLNYNWERGDLIKKQLKAMYAQGEDVSSFVVHIEAESVEVSGRFL